MSTQLQMCPSSGWPYHPKICWDHRAGFNTLRKEVEIISWACLEARWDVLCVSRTHMVINIRGALARRLRSSLLLGLEQQCGWPETIQELVLARHLCVLSAFLPFCFVLLLNKAKSQKIWNYFGVLLWKNCLRGWWLSAQKQLIAEVCVGSSS